ncbi:MAG: ClbS/DfsB family four-helix bundle protein [Anaerolineales bacterium]
MRFATIGGNSLGLQRQQENNLKMPRARSKAELLRFGGQEYARLLALIGDLTEQQRSETPVFDNRTVKDLIAHLYAWQLLFLTWYQEGMAAKKPQIPAPGFTWKDNPALNEKLYQEYSDASWKKIWSSFEKSHAKLMALVKQHSDKELTTKRKYSWTGSTDLATYLAGATSSHYVWAIGLIKRFKRNLAG